MKKIILLCASFFMVVLLFSINPARAQSALWVGPTGSDSNACSTTGPCATFAGAYAKGGVTQINCLSSGNYGQVTITGSLTIDCGSGNVGNIVSGTYGILIETTGPAIIILRHLAMSVGNNAFGGIDAQGFFSGTLIVENCMIQGHSLSTSGIIFEPRSGRGLLQVSNSQFFNHATGITVAPTSGQIASVTLNQVELVANSSDGLFLGGSGVVAGTMRGSVVGENGQSGVVASASQTFFTVEESSIVDNLSNGIQTNSAGSVVNVGASTIGGNGTGVLASSGSLISFGNNQMSVNATNGNFTSTTALR
jgi:Right handed beta helix region